MLKQIRYICAQPANTYYAWQVEVMLNNFQSMGINLNQVDIVCEKPACRTPEEWTKLAERYPARFFFYCDRRAERGYISSIRPNILKQHFAKHPEISQDVLFYHDCDIAFTRSPSEWITHEMIEDDNWYGSDTKWYIAYDYIISKGEQVLGLMESIMRMPEGMVKANNDNAIGAQYLMKNIDDRFWARVEMDCERLYVKVTELNKQLKQENPNYHELQIWCADMWALLWNAWKDGVTTLCHPAFDFSWGTSSLDDYNKMNIFHNAGVVSENTGLFHKAKYMDSYPYGLNLDIKPDTASAEYYKWIHKTELNSALL
jgi:hypothetical protein